MVGPMGAHFWSTLSEDGTYSICHYNTQNFRDLNLEINFDIISIIIYLGTYTSYIDCSLQLLFLRVIFSLRSTIIRYLTINNSTREFVEVVEHIVQPSRIEILRLFQYVYYINYFSAFWWPIYMYTHIDIDL